MALVDMGLRIGGVAWDRSLESDALLDLYWKVVGWYALLFIAFLIVIGGAVADDHRDGITGAELAARQRHHEGHPLLVDVVGYLALALSLSVAARL